MRNQTPWRPIWALFIKQSGGRCNLASHAFLIPSDGLLPASVTKHILRISKVIPAGLEYALRV